MFRISSIISFSAAHFLRNYKGKCESLHGHNWKIQATVSCNRLDKSGMVIDFTRLKEEMRTVTDGLDHCLLNDLDYFKKHNPSSEEIARYIFMKLKDRLSGTACKLEEVRVWETDNSCAAYSQ